MAILFVVYLVIGLLHANSKVNNSNPLLRPGWANDQALPFLFRVAGFLMVAVFWPLSMLHG